jgi:hypothetical protein
MIIDEILFNTTDTKEDTLFFTFSKKQRSKLLF